MRASLWFCSTVIGLLFLGGQQKPFDPCSEMKTDPYSLESVRAGLKQFGMDSDMISDTGFITKRIVRLGDAASIGVLKIVDPEKLKERRTCEAYLLLVKTAFACPNKCISLEVDKDPKVTLFLLDYLHERVKEDWLQLEIYDAKAFVKAQTTTSNPITKSPN